MRWWPTSAAGILVLAGCDNIPPSLSQNCEVVAHSPSNSFDLDYQLLLPYPCPAPIGSVGERKVAAGEINDRGTRDFEFAELILTNSKNEVKANNVTRFIVRTYPVASPRVEYPAATGAFLIGDHLSSQHWDYGRFMAFNRDQIDNTNNPYGTVQIRYRKSAVNVSISGPDIPSANTVQTWEAIGYHGEEPYTFKWYRDSVAVGTGRYYTADTGPQPFGLLVDVVDASYSTSATVLAVDVNGIRVEIDGPETVYVQDGGTWYAAVRGGFAPYVFHWFVDDQHVATGPSWSGYPGAGTNRLHLQVSDAGGASHSDTRFVHGLGTEDCVPEPGELRCTT
jgi:hypothetical protein